MSDVELSVILNMIMNYIVGFDIWLQTLLLFMFLDIVTGVINAILGTSTKSLHGGLNSQVMWKSGAKKLLTIILVIVAATISALIEPQTNILRTAVISYYIAVEALSILENAASCGLPLPQKLLDAIDVLKGAE